MFKKMNVLSALITLSFVLGCGAIKQAKTTPATIEAFKTANAGLWISECTEILNINDPTSKNSAQISVNLQTDSTALIQVTTYSGNTSCARTASGTATNVEKNEYDYLYSNIETVFSNAASMRFVSQPREKSDVKVLLNIKIKTTQISTEQFIADVELASGKVTRSGIEKEIPQSIVNIAKLKFVKAIL